MSEDIGTNTNYHLCSRDSGALHSRLNFEAACLLNGPKTYISLDHQADSSLT